MSKNLTKDNLLKSTTIVGLMTFLSRISGLIRDIIYARLFGALPLMDAFLVAFRVPNSFRRFFAEGAFSRAFIPVLSDYEENEDEEGIKELIDRTAGTLGTILFFITSISETSGITLFDWCYFFTFSHFNFCTRIFANRYRQWSL